MIRQFHQARRHEEGQALVIACISMLILAMCILSTVNIAYAARQRVQLQNAADAAAYTTAAHEARAMNLLAYTNRAMIVQYVSQMDLLAIVSYANFNVTVIRGVMQALSQIPYVGFIFAIIGYVYLAIAIGLLIGVTIALPLIDGITYRLSLVQTGIVDGLKKKIADGSADEVKAFNPNYLPPVMLSKTLLGVDETERWGSTGTMVAVDGKPIYTAQEAGINGQAAFERLLMVEMTNAARPKFTAYGDSNKWSLFLFPRAFNLSRCPPSGIICIDKVARTEWGSLYNGTPGGVSGVLNPYLGNLFSSTEQMFSLDRFRLMFKVLGFTFGVKLDSYAFADRSTILNALIGAITSLFGLGPLAMPSQYVVFQPIEPSGGGGIFGSIVKALIKTIMNPLVKYVQQFIEQQFPWQILKFIPLVHFGMWPYAKFRPVPSTGGFGTTALPGAAQLFNQPTVLLMVTAPTSALKANGRPFLGNFGFRLGGYRSNGAPKDNAYRAARNSRPSKRGYVEKINFDPGDRPFSFITTEGFHAMSAAMAYYHRPGDWREPPNLFNPMWGAKLMPVMDYPTIGTNGAMADILGRQLLVH